MEPDIKEGRSLVDNIKHALDFLRNHQLEVPFIAFYRKEYVPDLRIRDLWRIWQWDEKVGMAPAGRMGPSQQTKMIAIQGILFVLLCSVCNFVYDDFGYMMVYKWYVRSGNVFIAVGTAA